MLARGARRRPQPQPPAGLERKVLRCILVMAGCEPWRSPPQRGRLRLRLKAGVEHEMQVDHIGDLELYIRLRWVE